MTVFKLKKDHVVVTEEERTVLGVKVGGGIRHITYSQFYDILRSNELSEEETVYSIYQTLMEFFSTNTIKFPKSLVKLRKTSEGLVCTQIFGGEGKVFTESNFDTSRVRVDYLINNERVLVKDSIVAYRYSGVVRAGFLQEGVSVELPSLTGVMQSILRTNKTVNNLEQADIQKLIRRVPQRCRGYNRLEPYFNTDTEIRWEEF